MKFSELPLSGALLRALTELEYETPTPIQERAIPRVCEGKDLLGVAQTGTGKTAAFALPILERLAAKAPGGRIRPIRCLVLAPTRELAQQIHDSFVRYGKHAGQRCAVVFGGVGYQPQIAALRRGVDILVATPGRLIDLVGQGFARFDALEVLVLDEADRMLDMGFLPDVKRIVERTPRTRQSLLFSATMPREIADLASEMLREPVRVEVTPAATTVERIDQKVFFVGKSDKRALLEHVLQDAAITRALVFTRTKHGADKVADQLGRARVRAAAIHGNKAQGARQRALSDFKRGDVRVLVATDIAARGIDVADVSHVINFDIPHEPESYVHRIGRTARAGREGVALSFCDETEIGDMRRIERIIRQRVAEEANHPYRMEPVRAGSDRGQARRPMGRFRPIAVAPREGSGRISDRHDRPWQSARAGDENAARPAFPRRPRVEERPRFDERPRFEERPRADDRPRFGDRPRFSERPRFGDRPRFDDRGFGGRGGFTDRPRTDEGVHRDARAPRGNPGQRPQRRMGEGAGRPGFAGRGGRPAEGRAHRRFAERPRAR